ncbi:MAG TPA: TIR domain-containing protein [Pyrinomonadaceae bacterium]|nr:TIR domain-containing protein [Pyrinomonadaceae bacterium]
MLKVFLPSEVFDLNISIQFKMTLRTFNENGGQDEFSVSAEIGKKFACYQEELNAPTDEQFDSLWQAQIEYLAQKGRGKFRHPDSSLPVKNPTPLKKKILLIENDEDVALDYRDSLEESGFKVIHIQTADRALEVAKTVRHFDIVVIDIRMPCGGFFGEFESSYGRKTGILLANELINHIPDVSFVALTNSREPDDAEWFEGHEGFGFAIKGDTSPRKFARYLRRIILKERPRPFIVHGHDLKALYELKDYLQNTLMLGKPIILKDETSKGMTVIEKLEKYADETDIVFALFTPDDLVTSTGGAEAKARARQNVIYEVGLFHAHFGRKSGKVILLYKKGVEMPSDLSGLIPINISDGILAADEEIRRELQNYLL